MRTGSIVAALFGVVLVAAGVVLVAFLFIGRGTENTATNSGDPEGFNVPKVSAEREQAADEAAGGPEDKTLTVSKMARVENAAVPDDAGDDEEALGENAAIHLKGTDSPGKRIPTCTWQATALATRTLGGG